MGIIFCHTNSQIELVISHLPVCECVYANCRMPIYLIYFLFFKTKLKSKKKMIYWYLLTLCPCVDRQANIMHTQYIFFIFWLLHQLWMYECINIRICMCSIVSFKWYHTQMASTIKYVFSGIYCCCCSFQFAKSLVVLGSDIILIVEFFF